MKKLTNAICVFSVFISSAAYAMDVPVHTPPRVPVNNAVQNPAVMGGTQNVPKPFQPPTTLVIPTNYHQPTAAQQIQTIPVAFKPPVNTVVNVAAVVPQTQNFNQAAIMAEQAQRSQSFMQAWSSKFNTRKMKKSDLGFK
ncbi:MAG TPA: hypothetical protein PKY78_04000 [Candidatus Omnitrophota bacterium]|nr:hypothetical protein [Candidatus Omnitrophota bacterium]HPS20133.1 hypothetical protein [Candidatus Omnitrophota bacterium]